MKKIGFITSPLNSGHAVRGVGFYLSRLLPQLKSNAPSFGFEILEISDYLGFSNLDLELIHYPHFDLFTHSLPFYKNTPTVVTIHDVIPLEFPQAYPKGLRGWVSLQLQKLSLSDVDRVITDSFASVRAIKKHLRVPDEKLKLVYLAADPIYKQVSKPKNKFDLPKKFVLYVGDVNYNKNIPNLISACKITKYPLVMVGKQSKDMENMNFSHPELVHLKDVEFSGVIRLGFVSDEDLVDIYNLATVYCQPSFSEGFGLPVLEALACDTPVACSNTSSLPELAGDSASYFNPHDVTSISQALLKAKSHHGPTQAAKFSWEKAAQQTLQVYSEII
ncbi:MAG: glycosyltransferase family 1 protein [Patescibacteria group bacterium]